MNRLAIFYNNNAIAAIRKGYPYQAFELLSDAVDVTFKQSMNVMAKIQQRAQEQEAQLLEENLQQEPKIQQCNNQNSQKQQQQQQGHHDASHQEARSRTRRTTTNASSSPVFTFAWHDCSIAALYDQLPDQIRFKRGSGSSQLLCLYFFEINTTCSNENELEEFDISEFNWIIWYNLATICSYFGTLLEDRGMKLLYRAKILYEKVQESTPQQTILSFPAFQLAVWNNQACTLSDLQEFHDCKNFATLLVSGIHVLSHQQQEQQQRQEQRRRRRRQHDDPAWHGRQQGVQQEPAPAQANIPVAMLDFFQVTSFVLSQKHLFPASA